MTRFFLVLSLLFSLTAQAGVREDLQSQLADEQATLTALQEQLKSMKREKTGLIFRNPHEFFLIFGSTGMGALTMKRFLGLKAATDAEFERAKELGAKSTAEGGPGILNGRDYFYSKNDVFEESSLPKKFLGDQVRAIIEDFDKRVEENFLSRKAHAQYGRDFYALSVGEVLRSEFAARKAKLPAGSSELATLERAFNLAHENYLEKKRIVAQIESEVQSMVIRGVGRADELFRSAAIQDWAKDRAMAFHSNRMSQIGKTLVGSVTTGILYLFVRRYYTNNPQYVTLTEDEVKTIEAEIKRRLESIDEKQKFLAEIDRD